MTTVQTPTTQWDQWVLLQLLHVKTSQDTIDLSKSKEIKSGLLQVNFFCSTASQELMVWSEKALQSLQAFKCNGLNPSRQKKKVNRFFGLTAPSMPTPAVHPVVQLVWRRTVCKGIKTFPALLTP